jgi:hypothetical protein
MELSDLLDELRNNILYDRSDSVSGDPDQLWSDATLVRYINEAQRRFAKSWSCNPRWIDCRDMQCHASRGANRICTPPGNPSGAVGADQ